MIQPNSSPLSSSALPEDQLVKLPKPAAIIFDCDGVLVDSEVIHVAAEMELLADLGLAYDRETYLTRFVGLSNADFHAAIRSDFAGVSDTAFPADFAARLHQLVWPRIETELKAIEGVEALVRSFNGQVAVGSSSPYEKLMAKLAITGLQPLFAPHIYSADHVKAGKPEPDLFLHAAAELGVDPCQCLVIEDSLHGVVAARAAGMTAIGFTGGGHTDAGLAQRLMKSGAAAVVAHHAEVQRLFV